jgi:hypothetical protein
VKDLPRSLPFRDIFTSFLDEYSTSATYWYVPKTRVLNDETVGVIAQIVKVIFDEFLGYVWNAGTQDRILNRLVQLGIVSPYRQDGTRVDRTALIRIWKKLLETLGLLWVQDDKEIVITDAALDLLSGQAEEKRQVIERQIIKYQYPNPSLSGLYAEKFTGILPHIFLLQVLMKCDNRITSIEYELFVNLAQSQDDINRIVKYIHSWRDINEQKQQVILKNVQDIVMNEEATDTEISEDIEPEEERTRFKRIHLNASYQKPFFTFPSNIEVDEGDIVCPAPDKVNEFLSKEIPSLKITKFRTLEDWFAYFGDPRKEPSWSTYLISLIQDATTTKEVEQVVKTAIEEHKLTQEETEDIERAQIEKDIETLYYSHPDRLEKGLIVKNRQFPTPIGRIDLLCISKEGEYVIVEIKAQEARDSVFGQILRYIGWVHRNIEGAGDKVRGIILASKFPETAHYSRIGLLKPDYKKFVQFHEYKL